MQYRVPGDYHALGKLQDRVKVVSRSFMAGHRCRGGSDRLSSIRLVVIARIWPAEISRQRPEESKSNMMAILLISLWMKKRGRNCLCH